MLKMNGLPTKAKCEITVGRTICLPSKKSQLNLKDTPERSIHHRATLTFPIQGQEGRVGGEEKFIFFLPVVHKAPTAKIDATNSPEPATLSCIRIIIYNDIVFIIITNK